MTPEQIKAISDLGFGMASFAALLFGGYRVLGWLEEVKSNHLPHIQASLDQLVLFAGQQHIMSEEEAKKLDVHTQMLGIIVDQTRK